MSSKNERANEFKWPANVRRCGSLAAYTPNTRVASFETRKFWCSFGHSRWLRSALLADNTNSRRRLEIPFYSILFCSPSFWPTKATLVRTKRLAPFKLQVWAYSKQRRSFEIMMNSNELATAHFIGLSLAGPIWPLTGASDVKLILSAHGGWRLFGMNTK